MVEKKARRSKKRKRKKPKPPASPAPSFHILDVYNWNWKRTPQRNAPVIEYEVLDELLHFEGEISIALALETNKHITCIKYGEDFKSLAVGDTEGRIHVYKTNTRKYLETLVDADIERRKPVVTYLTHRPVTTYYPTNNSFTCSYSNGWIKCWDYKSCKCIYTIKEKRRTLGVKYHPRYPKILTYGDDGKVFLYDEETKILERILVKSDKPDALDGHTSEVFAACFNPQASHELITGGWDNVVLFWDLRQPYAQRHIANVPLCGEGLAINSRGTDVVIDSDQPGKTAQPSYNPRRRSMAGPQLLAHHTTGSERKSFQVTRTYVRNVDEREGMESILKGMSQVPENLQFQGNVSVVFAAETTKDILCIKYTEEYDYVAVGFTDGKIRMFTASDGQYLQTIVDSEIEQSQLPVTCIKHRPVTKNYPIANSLTCTYSNGCVKCWNYNFNQCIYTIREKRETLGIRYHPRLPKFVTYGDDAKVYLYDEETRTQERILGRSEKPAAVDGHKSKIFAACFNPQSNHELITGGWDNIVLFWDLRQPYALRHISDLHICGEGIDINSRGTEILTSSWQLENPLQIWDYGSGNLKEAINPDPYSSKLYCGRFLNKDYIICGGSDPNIIRIVDLHTHQTAASVTGLNSSVYSLDVGDVKKKKVDPSKKFKIELSTLPKMIFCSGKKLYQIDFS